MKKPFTLSKSESFTACPILTATIQSTGQCSGDAGHGGRHVLELKMEGGALESEATDDGVVVEARGDHEALVLGQALVWAGLELLKANGHLDDVKLTLDSDSQLSFGFTLSDSYQKQENQDEWGES